MDDAARREANKLVVRRIYEEGYNGGDPAVFESLYAPGFTHRSKVTTETHEGGLGEAQSMARFRAAIPDVTFRVLSQIAENDWVATRLRITGHPVSGYGPVSGTEALFDVHSLVLFRIEDGRAAEEWLFVDGGSDPDPEPDSGS
ncbi:MAG TPA: ester cyclase [Frankiaceae bacterium]|jgi:predicted ester cyclase|nr:ester cyclase [Frankiaceae bacterium]